MKPSKLQLAYLTLAALGLVATWTYNIKFMLATGGGFALMEFIRGGFANHAASSLTVDLLIGASAFTLWSFVEARRLHMRNWWVYFVLTNVVAFAFAAPLFLLMRERKLLVAAG